MVCEVGAGWEEEVEEVVVGVEAKEERMRCWIGDGCERIVCRAARAGSSRRRRR